MARNLEKRLRSDARILRLRLEPLEDRRMLAVLTVDSNLDIVDPGNGVTSLREAIAATNGMAGADSIDFAAGLDGATINLDLGLGELSITDAVTIDASSLANGITINAGDGTDGLFATGDGIRIFNIDDGVAGATIDVELIGLTLTGGDTIPGIDSNVGTHGADGGAIRSKENLTLTGSTVTGNATGGGGDGYDQGGNGGRGGGIFSDGGSLSLVGCTVSGNRTGAGGADQAYYNTTPAGSGGHGGGIFSTGGAVTITSSSISGNETGAGGEGYDGGFGGKGGGIYCTLGTLVINDSVIEDNVTGEGGEGFGFLSSAGRGGDGGGIFNSNSAMTLTGSNVSGNNCGDGGNQYTYRGLGGSGGRGGGISNSNGNLTITASTISGNTSGFGGKGDYDGSGGIGGDGGGIFTSTGNLTVVDSSISGNQASAGHAAYSPGTSGRGGGIFGSGGTLSINTSTIDNNIARGGTGFSGFHYYGAKGGKGGGIFALSALTITQSTVSGNMAYGFQAQGGGIAAQAPVTVLLSTITNNHVDSNEYYQTAGGGIWNQASATVITGSIVANNTIAIGGGTNPDLRPGTGTLTVNYSLIGSTANLTAGQLAALNAGTGNILNANPMLGALADNGGPTRTHALLTGSQAIDAGNPGFASPPDYDQRGFAYERVVGGTIDMGAFEFGAVSADFNEDGSIDGLDFLAWQIGFGTTAPNAVKGDGDADNDTDVDADDLAVWEATYGAEEGEPLLAALTVGEWRFATLEDDTAPAKPALNARLVDLAIAANGVNAGFRLLDSDYVDEEPVLQDSRSRAITEFDAGPRLVAIDFGDILASRPSDDDSSPGESELVDELVVASI